MAELKITKNNFEAEVVRSELPVLLDFWAPWCAPCRMLSPVVEQIAGEYEGKAKVGKVNVDEEQELAAAFGVSSIPMVVVVKAGKEQAASVGFQPKAQLAAMLEKEI